MKSIMFLLILSGTSNEIEHVSATSGQTTVFSWIVFSTSILVWGRVAKKYHHQNEQCSTRRHDHGVLKNNRLYFRVVAYVQRHMGRFHRCMQKHDDFDVVMGVVNWYGVIVGFRFGYMCCLLQEFNVGHINDKVWIVSLFNDIIH